MTTREELAGMLKRSRRVLLDAVAGVTAERARLQPAEGEWSIVEVLAHLIDTDRHYAAEALAMRDDGNHMLVYFDDEAWKAEHARVRETPLPDILSALDESHEMVLSQLASMGESELSSPGLHPRGIPYTVRHVFLRLPQHDDNHTRQIQEILSSI